MKYAILTAKHHDGFALWESDVEELGGYSVKATEWYKREVAAGRSGDIVKRFVDSFRSRGLAPGLYLSIWDRTAGLSRKSTKDKKWATQFVKAQITQLLTRYGEIPVLWTDGWKWFDGEQPDGPVGYDLVDFREIYAHIKQISPNTLLMENNHEKNLVHTDIVGFERNVIQLPPSDNRLPSEVCDTLRADDKWFFHPEGNEDVKSVEFIVDSLRACKERNAAYLLDVTPDREGRIPEAQAARLRKVGQVLKKPEGRL